MAAKFLVVNLKIGQCGSRPAHAGDCRELVVKVGGEEAAGLTLTNMRTPKENKRSKMQFEAKLGDSGDTFLRYQNAWKRDFYRALYTLRKLQQARRSAAANPNPHTG